MQTLILGGGIHTRVPVNNTPPPLRIDPLHGNNVASDRWLNSPRPRQSRASERKGGWGGGEGRHGSVSQQELDAIALTERKAAAVAAQRRRSFM